jgi:hypothetical protein
MIQYGRVEGRENRVNTSRVNTSHVNTSTSPIQMI